MAKNKNINFIIIVLISICIFSSGFNFTMAEEATLPVDENNTAEEASNLAPQPENTDTAVNGISNESSADAEAIINNEIPNQIDIVDPAKSEPLILDISETSDGTGQTSLVPDTVTSDESTNEISGEINNDTVTAIPVNSDNHNVNTGIIRALNINSLTIVGEWQMSVKKENAVYLGEDDSPDSRGQFLPSGQFEVEKPLAVCALIGDLDGTSGINSVKATVNYPDNIAVSQDLNNEAGCGRLKGEIELLKMDKNEAEEILCSKIRNNNNNLVNWNLSSDENISYGYEQVCGDEGYIAKESVALFCGEISLAYNDPAGSYSVKITAHNNANLSDISENSFKYLELTTFENDFSDIQYGPVKLNEIKILTGDTEWGAETNPTVRNTGNTRLQIMILQNDFGFGKTNGYWNISYQARVGSTAEFVNYPPEQITLLNNAINLGETVGMDFSAFITKFPDANGDTSFSGNMILTAGKALPLTCK